MKKYKSNLKTPWDGKEEISNTQSFIKNKYKSNYYNKHPKLVDTEESRLLNSIEMKTCRLCGSKNITKRGFTSNGIQRYYCKECNHCFTVVTNTIFENHKIPISEWIEFILNIFNYGSISLTSKTNKNSITTTTYWLNKLFLLLKDWQRGTILKGIVYIDEMFYSVIKSDIEIENGKKLRGLSRNQHCIGIGYDGTNIIAIVEGKGKTSSNKTQKTFQSHIESKSKIIHDDEKSHKILVDTLNLISESYSSIELKEKKDDENPLRPINHQCDLLRQFLNAHSGFDREHLQDYLNLYCFMHSGSEDKLEKIEKILQIALNFEGQLKYRALFKKKS